MIQVREVSIVSEEAQQLIRLLDQELDQLYEPEHRHYVDFSTFHPNGGRFVVAFEQDYPVGCGGLRPFEPGIVEVKRMFVRPELRGRGISRQVLAQLELLATEMNAESIVLETGDKQLAAISLYEKCNYLRVEPFGEYIKSSASICFRKSLETGIDNES